MRKPLGVFIGISGYSVKCYLQSVRIGRFFRGVFGVFSVIADLPICVDR